MRRLGDSLEGVDELGLERLDLALEQRDPLQGEKDLLTQALPSRESKDRTMCKRESEVMAFRDLQRRPE
jgi:hypothetical protein